MSTILTFASLPLAIYCFMTLSLGEILAYFFFGSVAWATYSVLVRYFLRNTFLSLKIVSATRPTGNLKELDGLIKQLPPLNKELSFSYVHHLFGTNNPDGDTYMVGDRIMLCVSQDGEVSLLSKEKLPDSEPLESMVRKMGRRQFIVDSLDFYLLMNKLGEAKPAKYMTGLEGDYYIAFRDYCNFEEDWGIMCDRGGIENAILLPGSGICRIKEDGRCELLEQSKLLGFIPISITWYGSVVDVGKIVWDSSALRLGWKIFGKLFVNPAAAESHRANPWKILSLPSSSSGDASELVVFEREGKGRLLGVKEIMLGKN
jgi:hypothetical protein